jgi:hypothetical protein
MKLCKSCSNWCGCSGRALNKVYSDEKSSSRGGVAMCEVMGGKLKLKTGI